MSAAAKQKQLRFAPIDDEDRAREREAKEAWYDVRDGLGRGDSRAHKVASFLVPHGEMHTLCDKNIYAAFVTRTTSDPFEARPHHNVRVKCRRCEAEILSGRWVYA